MVKMSDFIPTCIIHVILLKKTVTTHLLLRLAEAVFGPIPDVECFPILPLYLFCYPLFTSATFNVCILYQTLLHAFFLDILVISIYEVGDRVSNIC